MKEKILEIKTDVTPEIKIRVIDKDDDTNITRHKKKYPFELENTVKYQVKTTKREFEFKIYKGYIWNGADIPKTLFWVGQSKDNNYLIPSMVHDFLLEFRFFIHEEILNKEITLKEYRRLTSLIFRELLKQQKTNIIKANIMAGFVDWYQKWINFGKWRKNEKDTNNKTF